MDRRALIQNRLVNAMLLIMLTFWLIMALVLRDADSLFELIYALVWWGLLKLVVFYRNRDRAVWTYVVITLVSIWTLFSIPLKITGSAVILFWTAVTVLLTIKLPNKPRSELASR